MGTNMNRFWTSSLNYPNKKNNHTSSSSATISEISNEEIIDDSTTTQNTGFDQTKNITNILSKNYLFDGQLYEIIQINDNKLTATRQMCIR